jgi:hypothetical protein
LMRTIRLEQEVQFENKTSAFVSKNKIK